MALVCYTDNGPQRHDYSIEFMSEQGDKWFFHFYGHQARDVALRAVRHYARGHLTRGDLERLNYAIEDVLEIEKLPPVTVAEAIGWTKWVDKVANWFCSGK